MSVLANCSTGIRGNVLDDGATVAWLSCNQRACDDQILSKNSAAFVLRYFISGDLVATLLFFLTIDTTANVHHGTEIMCATALMVSIRGLVYAAKGPFSVAREALLSVII